MAKDDKTQDARPNSGDLRRDLNALWKNTIDQFDEIKNVIVKSSTAGKSKLDSTFLKRQLEKLYQQLGESLLAHIEVGALEAPEEARETIERIDELRAEIAAHDAEYERLTAGVATDLKAKGQPSVTGPSGNTGPSGKTGSAAPVTTTAEKDLAQAQRAKTVRVEVPSAERSALKISKDDDAKAVKAANAPGPSPEAAQKEADEHTTYPPDTEEADSTLSFEE